MLFVLLITVDSGVQVLEDDITEFPNRVMNSHRGDLPLFHPSPNTNSSSPCHNHLLSSPKSAAAAALNASVPSKFSPTHYASSAATANHNPSNLSPNQMGGVYNSPEGVNKYSPSLAHSSPRSSVGGAGEDLKHVTNGPSKQLSPKNVRSIYIMNFLCSKLNKLKLICTIIGFIKSVEISGLVLSKKEKKQEITIRERPKSAPRLTLRRGFFSRNQQTSQRGPLVNFEQNSKKSWTVWKNIREVTFCYFLAL